MPVEVTQLHESFPTSLTHKLANLVVEIDVIKHVADSRKLALATIELAYHEASVPTSDPISLCN